MARRTWPRWRTRLAVGVLLALLVGGPLAVLVSFAVRDPPSTLIGLLERSGRRARQDWVPLEAIAPALQRAVILSEDARFCLHYGVDLRQLRIVLEELVEGGRVRGASTITMQVVKNTLLWPDQSYLRKAIEIPLAVVLDLLLSKDRILEIYLNVAQMGPGVFGAEAAARYHFGVPAAALDPGQAALLAATLPSPGVRDPARPGPRQRAQAARVERELPRSAWLFACLEPAP